MAQNNSRPRPKRHLHKGRALGCLTILILVIVIISSLISGCSKKNKGSDDKSKTSDVMITTYATGDLEGTAEEDVLLVCVDPGHGGNDPGSNYGAREERVDNLKYATYVYNEINKREGMKAIITREGDVSLDNHERADIANDAGADLYLALHRNYAEDNSANGVEVWIQKESNVIDDVLSYNLLKALKDVGIQSSRGVYKGFTNEKQENFEIIQFTDMPCCILELGFITNDEDNRLFDNNCEKYAAAIADVAEYVCKEYIAPDKNK